MLFCYHIKMLKKGKNKYILSTKELQRRWMLKDATKVIFKIEMRANYDHVNFCTTF